MNNNFKTKFNANVWPVLVGFFVTSVIMMIFEWTNSLIFPFPEGFDYRNAEQLRNFITNSHWSIYILVCLGWALGAFLGSYFLTKISQKHNFNLNKKYNLLITKLNKTELQIFILALMLTLGTITNYLMLQTALLFHMLSLPLFLIFTYLGYRVSK